MRTTLTIDDDLAGILRRRSKELGKPFKELVNNALRSALSLEETPPQSSRPRVVVKTKALGLKIGYDPDRMNQLADELEVEDYLRKAAKDDLAGH